MKLHSHLEKRTYLGLSFTLTRMLFTIFASDFFEEFLESRLRAIIT